MQIKICGLKRKEDVDYVNQSMPDWIGFVFAGEKRKIDYETAKALKQQLNPQIRSVGVFVNADISFITRLVQDGILDMIQLHGDENREYIMKLKECLKKSEKSDVPIIKAVRVKNVMQILEDEKLPVDYLLLDAFKEDEYGGSGKVFDHNLIPDLHKPYILAGGIGLDNVTEILQTLAEKNRSPVCVDVSSSVETDGFKDQIKIEELVQRVKSLEQFL